MSVFPRSLLDVRSVLDGTETLLCVIHPSIHPSIHLPLSSPLIHRVLDQIPADSARVTPLFSCLPVNPLIHPSPVSICPVRNTSPHIIPHHNISGRSGAHRGTPMNLNEAEALN
ncbi:unnamed protein product [Pleuronectes platessa]|uniref:Uncharacterized protein n=1 Tax=Pleuronectes platessa TaxID=8262 RepID=A0A9N7TP84_PLEPL|nr:unnamed protein product [Pleuronectes platessa]